MERLEPEPVLGHTADHFRLELLAEGIFHPPVLFRGRRLLFQTQFVQPLAFFFDAARKVLLEPLVQILFNTAAVIGEQCKLVTMERFEPFPFFFHPAGEVRFQLTPLLHGGQALFLSRRLQPPDLILQSANSFRRRGPQLFLNRLPSGAGFLQTGLQFHFPGDLCIALLAQRFFLTPVPFGQFITQFLEPPLEVGLELPAHCFLLLSFLFHLLTEFQERGTGAVQFGFQS
jgi:hypothetical protein